MAVTGLQDSVGLMPEPSRPAFATAPWRAGAVFALAALAGGIAAVLGSGGWPQVAGMAGVALFAWLIGPRLAGSARHGCADVAMSPAAAPGSNTLARQVIPVWTRNIEWARAESERATAGLLESFANLSGRLDGALGDDSLGASLALGATDEVLARHQDDIARLTETTRLAARLKDDMAGGVRDLAAVLDELGNLAREVQAMGRATHLLALNASVEATRAGAAGGGFAVVAQEVRLLAGQSREAGQQIARRVEVMRERMRTLHGEAARHDTDDDEIVRRAEEQSRAVVVAMLGSLAEYSRSSRTLRETSVAVQAEMEKMSMRLQFQDRLSQMLVSATEDMGRYSRWLAGEADPAAQTPAQWLERLEASYTMEEMRSSHHDTVQVERAAGVEFF